MNKYLLFLFYIFSIACSSNIDSTETKRQKEQAQRITIIRDIWGVPHIYGKTDADVVFGLMYAQCEESFERVESNYLQLLGRMAEVAGKDYLYQDLKMKIIYDTSAAIVDYHKAPPWLKALLHAFADGINYYLHTHPEVKPLALSRFEPWFALLFTDGAYISTNTGGLTSEDIKNLYGKNKLFSRTDLKPNQNDQQTGSNAFAIAPSKTASGKTLLYINPHVSFYFRTEVHLVSEEGLNAYGAVTWGQFFIFQGFNDACGWMHTSSAADAADLYEEKIIEKDKQLFYLYDGVLKPVSVSKIFIENKDEAISNDSISVYYTHHGPVMGSRAGKWLSLKEQNRSMNGLIQSWQRMKAKNFTEFKNTMKLKGNASTNTMYADNGGNIAYWHGNFIPKRDTAFNWELPVDGTIPATEWNGAHEINEIPCVENPSVGWLQNCNSSPFHVSGFHSLKKSDYPFYMASESENFRSLRALNLLEKENLFTIEKLVAVGYDHHLALFDTLLPSLFAAYDALPVSDALNSYLKEPVQILRSWDKKSSISSIATTISIFWTYQLLSEDQIINHEDEKDNITLIISLVKNTSAQQKLDVLKTIIAALEKIYGTWKIPWGDINRYQRLTGSIYPKFDDGQKSIAVGLAPAFFGSLPAYETVWTQNTQKQYGVAGNSFVAVVEFGEKVKARTIITGGQFFDPGSKHFSDQSEMFVEGKLKDVFFYKDDVEKNSKRIYHPGGK